MVLFSSRGLCVVAIVTHGILKWSRFAARGWMSVGGEDLRAIAAAALGAIERLVGAAQDLGIVRYVCLEGCHAEARGHRSREGEVFGHPPQGEADALGDPTTLGG